MRVGRFYAAEIVSGRLEPFAGASEIWQLDYSLAAFAAFTWPYTADEIVEKAFRFKETK